MYFSLYILWISMQDCVSCTITCIFYCLLYIITIKNTGDYIYDTKDTLETGIYYYL